MHFPCGGKYESTWEDGRDQGGTYVYADGLKLENDKGCLTGWRYCNPVWDRRFYDVSALSSVTCLHCKVKLGLLHVSFNFNCIIQRDIGNFELFYDD